MAVKHGHSRRGRNRSSEYGIWAAMKSRCNDKNTRTYHHYGGRGIKVCDRWNSFALFFEDMGPRPPGYSIDRIDADGDYEPSNCRWASRSEQANNKRGQVKYEWNDSLKTPAEIARDVGMSPHTLRARLKRGMSLSLAATPTKKVEQ